MKESRNSYIELNRVYFWTATINDWLHLLEDDTFKQIIVDTFSPRCVSSRTFYKAMNERK